MIRIGIIGTENSHCGHVARLCNIEKQVDVRVVAVWGESPQLAQKAADLAKIPRVVDDWRDMADLIDGVMIDHRHPKLHAEPARFYLSRGVPTFVDKPFTHSLRQAKALCALARRKRTPVTSFSAIAQEESFKQFRADCKELGRIACFTTSGPGDVDDEHGGVSFYGIHQVEAIVELLGLDIKQVAAVRHGRSCVAVLHYRNGATATMNLVHGGNNTFHWTAVGNKRVLARDHVRDSPMYLGGLRIFMEMFKTRRQPFPHRRLLAPVAVLEGVQRSLTRRQPVRLPRL